MCGISCLLTFCTEDEDNAVEKLKDSAGYEETMKMLSQRGPDLNGRHTVTLPSVELEFRAHVLWQQGLKPYPQPVVQGKSVMLLNGEIYHKSIHPLLSDTQWLSDQLNLFPRAESYKMILDLFRSIHGPYSVIFLNGNTNELYFIRDSLGRQSLLLGQNEGHLWLTSVASNTLTNVRLIELPPLGLYRINLSGPLDSVDLFPWQEISNHEIYEQQLIDVRDCMGLKLNVQKECLAPVWMKPPRDMCDWDFETIVAGLTYERTEQLFELLLDFEEIELMCDYLIGLLGASVRTRCGITMRVCKNCIRDVPDAFCKHAYMGILFSGGIDCTLIAMMADQYIDEAAPVDLLNVSFEKCNNSGSASYDTPDRLSARSSLKELQQLCPTRTWNLVEINVSRAELENTMKDSIDALLYPLDKVLDADLGAALWFAARGRTADPVPYTTPCRVLLAGSGADEMFGGYERYRKVFERNENSWSMLEKEMHLDWVRLPSRNLARDDRVIAAQGVGLRLPYIDEDLTHFVRNLKMSQRLLPSLKQGVGDKLLLRLCAFHLGLKNVSSMPKRAIQFGSRIADPKKNAKDKMK